MTIGDRLRQLRTDQDWTLEQTARLAGVSKDTVLDIEADGSSPTLRTVALLSGAFDLTLSEFLEGVKHGDS